MGPRCICYGTVSTWLPFDDAQLHLNFLVWQLSYISNDNPNEAKHDAPLWATVDRSHIPLSPCDILSADLSSGFSRFVANRFLEWCQT